MDFQPFQELQDSDIRTPRRNESPVRLRIPIVTARQMHSLDSTWKERTTQVHIANKEGTGIFQLRLLIQRMCYQNFKQRRQLCVCYASRISEAFADAMKEFACKASAVNRISNFPFQQKHEIRRFMLPFGATMCRCAWLRISHKGLRRY
jgi:hypothetical protein